MRVTSKRYEYTVIKPLIKDPLREGHVISRPPRRRLPSLCVLLSGGSNVTDLSNCMQKQCTYFIIVTTSREENPLHFYNNMSKLKLFG